VSSPTFTAGEQLRVRVPVTNTGARAGSEVVQVYVRPGASRLPRARTELRGFAKVHLAPGETREVEVVLDDRAFAYWDDASSERAFLRERLGDGSIVPADQGRTPREQAGWYVDSGTYEIVLGRSVADVDQVLTVEVVEP
jgi:beta-glucosidase